MADRLDLAQEATAYQLSTALLCQRAIKVEEAKEGPIIVDGKILCVDCRKEIPVERLAAKPDAARCCPCQQRHHSQVEKSKRR